MRASTWLRSGLALLSFSSMLACASTPAPAAKSCTAPTPQLASAAPATPATALAAADLVGSWTQYWAPCGRADTQRYVFLSDGRFGWRAPQAASSSSGAQGPVAQSGHYTVQAGTLVLQVERERFAACIGGCANQGEPRVVEHEPALSLSYELGGCPQNAEAEHVDASYRCFGIAGRAFWHHELSEAADMPADFQ